jgi:hypothetical protein
MGKQPSVVLRNAGSLARRRLVPSSLGRPRLARGLKVVGTQTTHTRKPSPKFFVPRPTLRSDA